MSKASVKVTVKDPETLTTESMEGMKQLIKLNNNLKRELKEACTTITLTEEKLVHIDLVTKWLNAHILNLVSLVINTINFTGDLIGEIKDTQSKNALHILAELKQRIQAWWNIKKETSASLKTAYKLLKSSLLNFLATLNRVFKHKKDHSLVK